MAGTRNATIRELNAARSLVNYAQALLEHDNWGPEVLRCLTEAHEALRNSLLILMIECLGHVLGAAQDAQAEQRRAALIELLPLVQFSFSALCPACKHAIGIQLSDRWKARERSLLP